MKKYLLAGAMVFSLVGAQAAFADVLPEGQKAVDTCAVVTGLESLPKLTVYLRSESLVGDDMGFQSATVVHDGDCLTEGKYEAVKLYAVDSEYAKTLPVDWDPANDLHAYQASMDIDAATMFYPVDSDITWHHNEYLIPGVDNSKHLLVVLNAGTETNMAIADTFPQVPEGVTDSIVLNEVATLFTDVQLGSTYADALAYLKANEIVSGYDDGSFKPNSTINRAEFTKIIVGATLTSNGLCMEDYANEDGSYMNIFSDVLSPVGSAQAVWYLDFVCQAKAAHLIDGYPDGSFKPEQEINFAEAAKIITTGFKLPVVAPANGEAWYKGYVSMLADKKAIPLTIHQFNQKITRGEMAEMMFRLKTDNTGLSSQTYADLQ